MVPADCSSQIKNFLPYIPNHKYVRFCYNMWGARRTFHLSVSLTPVSCINNATPWLQPEIRSTVTWWCNLKASRCDATFSFEMIRQNAVSHLRLSKKVDVRGCARYEWSTEVPEELGEKMQHNWGLMVVYDWNGFTKMHELYRMYKSEAISYPTRLHQAWVLGLRVSPRAPWHECWGKRHTWA